MLIPIHVEKKRKRFAHHNPELLVVVMFFKKEAHVVLAIDVKLNLTIRSEQVRLYFPHAVKNTFFPGQIPISSFV